MGDPPPAGQPAAAIHTDISATQPPLVESRDDLAATQHAFDRAPDATAVIDDTGEILLTNQAWTGFQPTVFDAVACGVGANYLEVCERAAARGDVIAADVVAGLSDVIQGRLNRFVADYPCATPDEQLWFRLEAVPIQPDVNHPATRHLLIRHLNITEWITHGEKLRTQAYTDPLTGLVNRRGLTAHLTQVLSVDEPPALLLLLLDIDYFKIINDRFGHLFGDRCLTEVAGRLKERLRNSDLVARWGGDEFVVVVTADTKENLQAATRRIRAMLDRPEAPPSLRLSYGAAYARQEDTIESLFERADRELRRAKAARGDRPFDQLPSPFNDYAAPFSGADIDSLATLL